ncbi:MAG: hypothetical protein AAFU85_14960 [Planctomycetota bacterium]
MKAVIGPYAQAAPKDLPQFYLWHLIGFTTAAAIAFAIARVLEEPTIRYGFMLAIIAAPVAIYSFSSVVAPDTRAIRKGIRMTGFMLTIGLICGAGVYWRREAIAPLTILPLFWVPQMILLSFCSRCRAALDGSKIV